MSSAFMKKDMDMFQSSVRKLSTEIGRAFGLWTFDHPTPNWRRKHFHIRMYTIN